MKTGYKVADVMTIKPIMVDASFSLKDCAVKMSTQHVGSLLIESKNKIVGIITEQDLVRKAMAKLLNPEKTAVEKIMVKDFLKISPDKDIYDALKVMRDYNIRHLPVFEKGELVGFLTIKDILKIEPQLFELIVEKFEIKEESRKLKLNEDVGEGICEVCGNYTTHLFEASNGSKVCSDCKETL